MFNKLTLYFKHFTINNVLLFISFISLLNNGILYSGIRIYIIIAISYLIFNNIIFKKSLWNPLSIEIYYFILLFFIILLFFPYDDHMEKSRSFTQRFEGRFITQLFRFILEILASSYFFIFFRKDKKLFNNLLYLAVLITISIGLIDLLILNKNIYFYLINNISVGSRFTSINIEPRMFGLILVYIYVYFSFMEFSNRKLTPIIVAIFFTISFSSIVFFIISFFYFNRKNIPFLTIISAVLFFFIFFILLPYASTFQLLYDRFYTVTTINTGEDYYPIFSVFEIFDRSALNALYNNKVYLYLGFGPNTISIPSSNFIPSFWYDTYEGILNTPPLTGFVNILSRSGFLFLTYLSINHFRKKRWFFFLLYLLQYNFIFYSFYLIIFEKEKTNE
jgi:hypothetical protein